MSTHIVSSVAVTDFPFHGRNVNHANTTDVKAASLLGLPAELRLKMYAEMSPPLNGHIAGYQSLVLSCKRLRAEAETEMVRNMQRFLEHVMSTWDKTHDAPLRIKMPTRIGQITNVEIRIPTSVLGVRGMFAKFPAAFALLPRLCIARLTFILYDDEDGSGNITSYAAKWKRLQGSLRFNRCVSDMTANDMKLCLDDKTESPHAPGSNVHEIRVLWENELESVSSAYLSKRADYAYPGDHERWFLIKAETSSGYLGFVWKRKQS